MIISDISVFIQHGLEKGMKIDPPFYLNNFINSHVFYVNITPHRNNHIPIRYNGPKYSNWRRITMFSEYLFFLEWNQQ